MSFNPSFKIPANTLGHTSILFTVSLTLASMILGSVIAVLLSWVWLASMLTGKTIGVFYTLLRYLKTRTFHNNPVIIEGVYTRIDSMSPPKVGK